MRGGGCVPGGALAEGRPRLSRGDGYARGGGCSADVPRAFYDPEIAFDVPEVAFCDPEIAFYDPEIAFYDPKIALCDPGMFSPSSGMHGVVDVALTSRERLVSFVQQVASQREVSRSAAVTLTITLTINTSREENYLKILSCFA